MNSTRWTCWGTRPALSSAGAILDTCKRPSWTLMPCHTQRSETEAQSPFGGQQDLESRGAVLIRRADWGVMSPRRFGSSCPTRGTGPVVSRAKPSQCCARSLSAGAVGDPIKGRPSLLILRSIPSRLVLGCSVRRGTDRADSGDFEELMEGNRRHVGAVPISRPDTQKWH